MSALRANRLVRGLAIWMGIEVAALLCHSVLIALLRDRPLAASMLAGTLSFSLLAGLSLVVVRLASYVFIPVLACGSLAYGFVVRRLGRHGRGEMVVADCHDRARSVARS